MVIITDVASSGLIYGIIISRSPYFFEFEYVEQMLKEFEGKTVSELKVELLSLLNSGKSAAKEKKELYFLLNIDKKHQDFISALSQLSYLKHNVLFQVYNKFV